MMPSEPGGRSGGPRFGLKPRVAGEDIKLRVHDVDVRKGFPDEELL